MTNAEELRLHNLFIKFKNEGKSMTKIQEELGIDNALAKIWNKSLREAKGEEKLPKEIKSQISGINEEGQYLSHHSFSFTISNLDKVKLDLQRIIGLKMDSDFAISQREKALRFLSIFDQYFVSISNINVVGDNLKVEYQLNTDEEEIEQIAKEAMQFYSAFYVGERKFQERILIHEVTKDNYKDATKILPYALKSLFVEDFNGINKTNFEGLPIDTQWIFFIGENGYGKTTLLQAIVIGLFGDKDEEEKPLLVKSGFNGSKIGVEFFNRSKSEIHNIGINFNKFLYLTCYGASRLQIQTEQTQNDIAEKSTTTYSLFNSNGVLLNIEYSMVIWYLKDSSKFVAVKKVFTQLIPYLEDIHITDDEKVFYIEKELTENGETYNPVTFEQLASGFRSLILMVGDMMIRLFKSQPAINEPSELAGIVIIDELDLHWHPKLQRELPKTLSDIFPKIQFIASTHSLVPLLGAPENSVLLKVNRTIEEGITAERVNIDFTALSADTMLRDIFDLEKYMSDAKIKAWERFVELQGLIHFEKDEKKKATYWKEAEKIANKYQFEL